MARVFSKNTRAKCAFAWAHGRRVPWPSLRGEGATGEDPTWRTEFDTKGPNAHVCTRVGIGRGAAAKLPKLRSRLKDLNLPNLEQPSRRR